MQNTLSITAVQTPIFHKHEDLLSFIVNSVPLELIREKMILAVTSKIVSLAEGCLVENKGQDKKALIRQEADYDLGEIRHGVTLTIKHGLMLPSAGIDESNSEYGDYIVYPRNPYTSAQALHRGLQKKWSLQEVGILITDSRTSPLRLGVVGVGLAFAGFHPVKNLIGTEDIFGQALAVTKVNLVDSLSAAAVLMMGEAAERCPLAVLHQAPVEFTNQPKTSDLQVTLDEDMYLPLYQHLIK